MTECATRQIALPALKVPGCRSYGNNAVSPGSGNILAVHGCPWFSAEDARASAFALCALVLRWIRRPEWDGDLLRGQGEPGNVGAPAAGFVCSAVLEHLSCDREARHWFAETTSV